jgi:hypothetical protein
MDSDAPAQRLFPKNASIRHFSKGGVANGEIPSGKVASRFAEKP